MESINEAIEKEHSDKKISKKLLCVIAVILCLGGIFVSRCFFNADKVVENLENAIINNNVRDVQKIIKSSDKRLEINSKNIRVLLSYYEENPSRLNIDMKNLLEGNNTNSPYKLEKGLGYKVVLQPQFIRVEGKADIIEIQVKHGNEVIETADKYSEIGPLVPGVYTVEATLRNDYVTKKESKEVDLFSSIDEGKSEIELFNDVSSIKVESNNPEAILYINDESTDKRIADIEDVVGLEEGTQIYAVIKQGERILKSNIEQIYGDKTYRLNFQDINEINSSNPQDMINLFIEGYETAYQNAINSGDFSIVSPYILAGSDVYNQYEQNISMFYEKNIKRHNKSWQIKNINDLGNDIYEVNMSEDVIISRDGKKTPTIINVRCTVEIADECLRIIELIEE